MPLPRATYRLQFRNGMDFARARRLVPYLRALGVSHLYASPLFTATTGSTHGYDVTRADEIDPSLGGLEGLRELSRDLHANGLGLVLDIVPNHMAASLENPWWRDVILWGKDSACAGHFDIDWRERLTLPFLGRGFDQELAEGTIRLALDRAGDIALRYYDSFYPLNPRTYATALAGEEHELARAIVAAADTARPEDANRSGRLLADEEARNILDGILDKRSQDRELLAAVHAAQSWQLTDWKTASHHLSYRRFFEIAGLVGLRVEDEKVFEDSHRLILDLVEDGTVDGLRIDHIDGLADPRGYLDRLRRAVGNEVYIVAEKILEKNETLPEDWPVQGTTGYEFITALADVLVNEHEGGRLSRAFAAIRPPDMAPSYEEEKRACKRRMLAKNFAGEVQSVSRLAHRLAAAAGHDIDHQSVAEAVRAVIVALPVYRTYATADGSSAHDRELMAFVCDEAERRAAGPAVTRAIRSLALLLLGEPAGVPQQDRAEFRARFQQLSGPIMAKALEDTLFYRENAFIALNEVGGEPGKPTGGVPAFHRTMAERAERMPHGLSTTSTHDTKRGEDARARLYTLSEAPDTWIAATRRWSRLNATYTHRADDRSVPEADFEWLFYQALAGAWPVMGRQDEKAMAALPERLCRYAEKALREAKRRSDWTAPDSAYERRATDFIEAALGNDAFLLDFETTLSPFIEAGLINSLSQTLVKLTAPGIPDIYQGSEQSDFSLVDPDNRPVLDPDRMAVPPRNPGATCETFEDYKQWLTATVLAARRDARPFTGSYLPLEIEGPAARHVVAFLRGTPGDHAITVLSRLTFRRTATPRLVLRNDILQNSRLKVPSGLHAATLINCLDGREHPHASFLLLTDLLSGNPLALLLSR